MSVVKSFFVAFSIYSKIPMPQFEWKEEDMRYSLCFFPWIGAVIGLLIYGWTLLCVSAGIGQLAYVLVGSVIPALISGGFHLDGFMDTIDAICSYQPKERKIEILKDHHVGAFAVIMLVVYYMVYLAAFSEIKTYEAVQILSISFMLSRVFSGLGVVYFPSAKKEGMLAFFANTAQKKVVKAVLMIELLMCAGFIMWISLKLGIVVMVMAFLTFVSYFFQTKKEFGGITGDTAGYFVVVFELVMVLVIAVCGYIL